MGLRLIIQGGTISLGEQTLKTKNGRPYVEAALRLLSLHVIEGEEDAKICPRRSDATGKPKEGPLATLLGFPLRVSREKNTIC